MGAKAVISMGMATLLSIMPVAVEAAPRNAARPLSVSSAPPQETAQSDQDATIGVRHGLVYAGVFAALIAAFVVVAASKDDSPDSP